MPSTGSISRFPFQIATSALNRCRRLCLGALSIQDRKKCLLASTEIFGHLSGEQLEALAKNASCQSFAPAETVFSQGDRGDSLFLVVSGSLDVFQASGVNLPVSLPRNQVASLHRSDIFGEMALCTGEARSASMICEKECVLIEIERKYLLPLLRENP